MNDAMDCGFNKGENFSIVSKQMGDEMHRNQGQEVVIGNLRAQVDQLTGQVGEKDHVIDHLQVQLATLKCNMTQQEEKVNEKVRLIREHIERNIKSLEGKNARLRRRCEEGEETVRRLLKEVERLREVNRTQMCGRVEAERRQKAAEIESSRLRRLAENRENTKIIQLEQEIDRLREGSDSSCSEPFYSSIDRNDIDMLDRSDRTMDVCSDASPPLPPRRTSASMNSVKNNSPPSSGPHPHFNRQISGDQDPYERAPLPPPPLCQREDGDGSVSNDYDEIPMDQMITNPMDQMISNPVYVYKPSSSLERQQQQVPPTPPLPHQHSLQRPSVTTSPKILPTPPTLPTTAPTPKKPPRPAKAHWETLLDSLALVGFTDCIPTQKCVKSSIGKLPRYSIQEELMTQTSPFQTASEPTNTFTTDGMAPVTELETHIERLKLQGACPELLSAPCLHRYPSPFTALTHLSSPALSNMALKIHQIILDYGNPANKRSDLFTVSRTLVSLLSGELVNETYTQLLVGLGSGSGTDLERSCYHLIAILLPFFLPSGRVLVYLRMCLEAQDAAGRSRFPRYCLRILQRTIEFGPRKIRPCRQETEATCRTPYQHAKPMSIPIHLPGGDYHVTGFDSVSSVAEVIGQLEADLGLRPARESGFTLFMEDPVNRSVRVPVSHSSKLCDVIAKWESNLTSNTTIPQVIGLHYERFLHLPFPSGSSPPPPTEIKFCALQLHTAALEGVHGMEVELATCLGAVIAQATEGNCPYTDTCGVRINTAPYIPENVRSRFRDEPSRSKLTSEFVEIWQRLRDVPSGVLFRKYCTTLERWKYNRSTLFRGLYSNPKDGLKTSVCVNVSEKKLTIINADKLGIMEVVEYDKIESFGGSPFSLTLKIASKTFSIMLVDKHKSYLLIELLAAYCRRTHSLTRDTP